MEAEVYDLFNAGIAVDLLVPGRNSECACVGIRLRPYGRNLPKLKMVLGEGETFEEALGDALAKAKAGRWESLNWATRPWATQPADGSNPYGL